MFFKYIDFLSPKITLYQQNILTHSSFISGLLSIIAVVLIILIAVYYSIDFFGRKNPTAYYFQRFVQDAGEYPINSSCTFHFINMIVNSSSSSEEKFDFNSFQIIGTDVILSRYINVLKKDLTLLDHWLYGPCQQSDLNGINNIINRTTFLNSACIRKYYNSLEKKYYDTDDVNFRWPKMKYGTFNSFNEFYNVIIEKCEDNILNMVMGNGNHCKSDNEINNIIERGSGFHFYFLDSYIDVLDYDEPIHKFIYRVENTLDKDYYSTNHINFRPSIIRTIMELLLINIRREIL